MRDDLRSTRAGEELRRKIDRLQGPILVLGASGFVGAHVMGVLSAARGDVWGCASRLPAWRLADLDPGRVLGGDVLDEAHLRRVLDQVRPAIVIDCVAYGAYSFEEDVSRIYRTDVLFKAVLVDELIRRRVRCYLHAGSSSEYGANAAAPPEDAPPTPNSHYAVAKNAASSLIWYAGKHRGLPCANLRLYSVYGPLEDRSRLIPTVVAEGLEGRLPALVDPTIARDFVYVEDVVEAFVDAALNLDPGHWGESFNVGTGVRTTIAELAELAREVFRIGEAPHFSSMPARAWDTAEWYADPRKAKAVLGWQARTRLRDGLLLTADWLQGLPDREGYARLSKRNAPVASPSVSAIVACYKDGQAIPIMVERLERVFAKLGLDYEIILVNDASPDDSEEVIRAQSRRNPRVLGVTHTRNFGSQAAFVSGMQLSSKDACVLLDGDLQDPPELIEQFVARWREGYEVVYGVRVKREAPWYMGLAYKAFYRLFDRFSSIPIPHDAGDFSLIDRKAVRWLLACPERDLFLRGLRAYVGFRQTGVDYVRPERMFGRSTNSLWKNLGWAKKGIFAFSRTPLDMLTFAGVALTGFTVLLAAFQVLSRIFFPDLTPRGVTTLMLLIMFFGSATLLAVSLLGEYVAKIFEEVKARPLFIRRHVIRDGEARRPPA